MATATKTWDFTTGVPQGWTFAAAGSGTGSSNTTNGLITDLAGKNLTESETLGGQGWQFSSTLAATFGIGTGDTVTQIGLGTDGVDWLCTTAVTIGATHVAAQLQWVGVTGLGTTNLCSAVNFTGTTTRATNLFTSFSTGSALGSAAAKFLLQCNITTGNSSSGHVTLGHPKIVVTITYTPASGGASTTPLPKVIGQAVQRAATRCWTRRRSGIVVPRLWTPDGATI